MPAPRDRRGGPQIASHRALNLKDSRPEAEGEGRPEYRAILDEEGLETVAEELGKTDAFALDLETTGLDPMKARIVGIAVSPRPYVGYRRLSPPVRRLLHTCRTRRADRADATPARARPRTATAVHRA